MLKIKKILTLVLLILITLTSVFVFDRVDSYGATKYKEGEALKSNKTYYCDLDGDGKKEKIKQIENFDPETRWTVKLYINGKLKKTYYNIRHIAVYIYDFNKYDKRKEIYVRLASPMGTSYPFSNIFRYNKNGTFKNYQLSGSIDSYNNKIGVIKFWHAQSDENSNFKSFSKVLGSSQIIDYSYKKITKSSFSDVLQKTTNVGGDSAYYEYSSLKTLTAYTSTSGKKVAYKIDEGEIVHVVSLYKSGSKRYIKVKNFEGRYGWVKVGNLMLFE